MCTIFISLNSLALGDSLLDRDFCRTETGCETSATFVQMGIRTTPPCSGLGIFVQVCALPGYA